MTPDSTSDQQPQPGMTVLRHVRETLLLAWPVIVGQIGHLLISSADTIMVGGLGSRFLAASSISNGLFYLIAVIGIGACVVMSPLTAQLVGADSDAPALRRRLHNGMLAALYIAVISTGVLLALAELIPHLDQQPDTVAPAQSFLRIISLSLPPMLLYLALKHFLDGFEAVVPGMAVMGLMVVLNIGLNWVLINGHLGFPALGLDGAGWATLGSRIIGAVVMAVYVARHPRFGEYFDIRASFKHDWEELKAILKVGLPSGFQYFFEVGAFSGAVLLAGRISSQAQSAHQIAIQIASFTYMFYMGISTATSIRVGNAYGRHDLLGIRRASIAGIATGLGFVVLFISSMVGLHRILPWLYIQEAPVVAIASQLLLIAAIFQFFDGMQAIMMGALRGTNDVMLPTAITFIAYWILGLPAAWLFAEQMAGGVSGIWYGLTSGLGFSALMLGARLTLKLRGSRQPLKAEAGT